MTQSGAKIEYNEKKDPSILEWMLDRKKQLWHYPLELTICLLAISLSVYHLFVAYAGSLEAHAFRSTHLSFMLVLCFLLRPLGRDKWTDPKNGWFAVDLVLVALTIGSINATSLLLVGLAPALWVGYEMVLRRSWTPVWAALRIGVLTAGVSLWWVAGVRTQGSFGPNVLRFTETYEAGLVLKGSEVKSLRSMPIQDAG